MLSRRGLARDAVRYFTTLLRSSALPFLRQLAGDTTLADLTARWARKRPQALALQVGVEQLTFRELDESATVAASFLHALGARRGDVAALVGKNSIAYVALLLGGARRGITLALVHPELGGEPLRQALEVSEASYVVCEAALGPAMREASDLPLATFDPLSRRPFGSATEHGEFVAHRHAHDFARVFTSGTTGLPKACRLPHSRVLSAACLFGAPMFDFRAGDKLLCALPLHHGSPLMLGLGSCLITGTPLVLEPRFSARRLLSVAIESEATALLYVGDLGRLLLATPESPDDRRHRLRVAVGNGMAPDVWPQFQARFGIESIREFYAATESPVGIFNLSGRTGSVGNLPYAWMFGLKLVRLDGDGELLRDAQGRLRECDVDEPGELLVRARRSGLGVYHGYVDRSATEARLVRDAFAPGDALFRTFDVLRRDRDGYYYFVERGGDSFRFRGENVSAAQVERELLALPGVREALVAGVSVPGYDGKVGLAVLVGAPDFDVASLVSLQERLPRSAVPRFVRRVSDLSRTSSLKLRRRVWATQGVDPALVEGELWVLRGERYEPLDLETYRDIVTGKQRL